MYVVCLVSIDHMLGLASLIFVFVTCLKLLLTACYHSTDFEVHRNWLAITHSLPISEWYFDTTSEWTLDYPPFFAWWEYLLSQVARYAEPSMVKLQSTYLPSSAAVLFQRGSVMLSDTLLCCAIYRLGQSIVRTVKEGTQHKLQDEERVKPYVLLVLGLCNPGLLMVDHVHFQYNGMLLGLLLWSVACLYDGRHLFAAFLFSVLVHLKHIFLYVAPVFGTYLLARGCFEQASRHDEAAKPARSRLVFLPGYLLQLALISIAVSALSLGPFLLVGGTAQLFQIWGRLFPFAGRGLCHAYWAPNLWAVYRTADMALARVCAVLGPVCSSLVRPGTATANAATGGLVQDAAMQVLPQITPLCTVLLTIACMLPAMWCVWRTPQPAVFLCALSYSAMCSFMCGWHVHEKAILLVLLPVTMHAMESQQDAKLLCLLSLPAHVSLFPLLFRLQEAPIKILLTLIHFLLCLGCLQAQKRRSKTEDGPAAEYVAADDQQARWTTAEIGYLLGFVFLQACVGLILPWKMSRLEFLPLLLTSLYCALGLIYCWYLLLVQMFQVARTEQHELKLVD
eukprot:g63783.t1